MNVPALLPDSAAELLAELRAAIAELRELRAAESRLAWRIEDFAELTGLSRSVIYREIAAGRLRTTRYGESGVLVTRESWAEWRERQTARRRPRAVAQGGR